MPMAPGILRAVRSSTGSGHVRIFERIGTGLYGQTRELAGSYHTFPLVGPPWAPEVQRLLRDCAPANGAVIAPACRVYRAVTRKERSASCTGKRASSLW